ncbi:hypothetical protein SSP24_56940 [Streptomyces spinoverrucosus]|uniref:Uncharacterized protein n=1 Tax=Streptomyces spinoverrucosus TaxID=284043 RepID=A0A4Y3VQS7_9ACTN|nr:hypothetical protein SSP24_56940 [Streptomyces spinoverrucosus]GHB89015.1 hypothetical protein GCM10010397_71250 [Streptomyces spinoverrucosus]
MLPTQTPFGGSADLVCRCEDVREVLSDPDRFSSARVLSDVGGELDEEARATMLARVEMRIAWGGAVHRLLAVAAMAGSTARARKPPVRARTG